MPASRPIVTLTTDFGSGSAYIAQMKGVILSIHRDVVLVDVTHDIPPQAVRHGALTLDDACWRFPPGSIHVAVVDPGVGTDRAILLAEIEGHWFIAPDNGLLSLASFGRASQFRRLTNARFWLPDVSATFHGRDIMAPAAAHLAAGAPPAEFGPVVPAPLQLDWPRPEFVGKECRGEVLIVDSFGNVVTNITANELARFGRSGELEVQIGATCVRGIVQSYAERPPGTIVALVGSSGRLEIAVVNGHAARELGGEFGMRVSVRSPSG